MTNSKMSGKIFYICVLTVLLYPHIYYGCPTMCFCTHKLTNCTDTSLTEVPSEIPVTVERLLLGYNQIQSLPDGVLSDLTVIISLNMQNNQIPSLPAGLFSNHRYFEKLYISSNDITSVPEGLFDNTLVLNEVDFSNNQITSVPEGLFANNPALSTVYISSNQLTSLPAELFYNNPALSEVGLFDNQLTSLPELFFSKNPALSEVYLQGNQFTSLPEGFFTNNPTLTELDLSSNQFITVSPNVFLDERSISPMTIYLGDNPLLCCNMSDLIDWIQDQNQPSVVLVNCSETPDTEQIQLQNLNTTVCPRVDGQWSDWSESNCSSICGVGNMTRTRECNNPEPSRYGQESQGEASDVIQCYTDCSTDEEFSWKPLVIGLVLGTCVIIGIVVLVTCCVIKGKGGRISHKGKGGRVSHAN